MGKLRRSCTQVRITALLSLVGILCALTWTVPSALAGISANPGVRPSNSDIYSDTPLNVNIVQKSKLHLGQGQTPSLGDELILSADLSFRRSIVGRLDGIFTTTRVERLSPSTVLESSVGLFTITFPSGQLTLQFFQRDDHQQIIQFAVTGGTGVFSYTAGQGTLTKTSDTTGIIRLHLLRMGIQEAGSPPGGRS